MDVNGFSQHNAGANDAPEAPSRRQEPVGEKALLQALETVADAVRCGVKLEDKAALMRVMRAVELHHNVATVLRVQMVAAADKTKAARTEGITTAEAVSQLRRIPLSDATTEVIVASRQGVYPRVLTALAEGKISQENAHTAAHALYRLAPLCGTDEFDAVEKKLLVEAEVPIPGQFRRKCQRLREEFDERAREAGGQMRRRRRQASYRDRGLFIKLVQDGEFGANLYAHLPVEYLREMRPVLEKHAEQLARYQREKHGKAANRSIRMLDVLYQMVTGAPPPRMDPFSGPSDANSPRDDGPSGGKPGSPAIPMRRKQRELAPPTVDAPAGMVPAWPASDFLGNGHDSTEARVERTRHIWDTTEADQGRNARLASQELRTLLYVRDGGCIFPTCTAVAEACVAHHIHRWEDGGATNLRNLVLICPRHHVLVEFPAWDPNHWSVLMDDRGIPAVIPPRSIDPKQKPQYHARFSRPVIEVTRPVQNDKTTPGRPPPDPTSALIDA